MSADEFLILFLVIRGYLLSDLVFERNGNYSLNILRYCYNGNHYFQTRTMLKNRRFWLLFSFAAILVILFLTFQNRNNTEELSNSLKDWLNSIGINVSGKQLRSNAHIVEYFLLGIALSQYGLLSNKKIGWIIFIGFCIGLVDEMMRIILPTREFELIDLLKDWLRIVLGINIACYFYRETK